MITQVGFESNSYNAGTTGYVVVTATDDISGIPNHQSNCWSIKSSSGNTTLNVCGAITNMGSNQYKIPFTIGDYVENGVYYLSTIYFKDAADNALSLSADSNNSYYQNTSISVPFVNIND